MPPPDTTCTHPRPGLARRHRHRLSYVAFCSPALQALGPQVFAAHFLQPLLALASDSVVNVRIILARMLRQEVSDGVLGGNTTTFVWERGRERWEEGWGVGWVFCFGGWAGAGVNGHAAAWCYVAVSGVCVGVPALLANVHSFLSPASRRALQHPASPSARL